MLYFHLTTVGCQMNTLDSELVAAALLSAGYKRTENPRRADIFLFNTCSVREHAEEKIYSALGRLAKWKARRPDGVIGVLGCMAQKDRNGIFRRAPHVDLVLGPGQLDRLPELIAEIIADRKPRLEVSRDRFQRDGSAEIIRESFRQYDPIRLSETRPTPHQAMVRIMFGCNMFCSYCIVPQVRGPEQSRPPEEIVREVETLAAQGVVEVALLGQTVNGYRHRAGERTTLLSDLLEKIDAIPGIRRIRFVSNYPTCMTDDLLQAVRDLPKVMPSIHVPAQHGADAVLERMRRRYTVAEYVELVDRIYATIPGAAVTSDFIVGFCGETEEEFQQMAELFRRCRFKNSFIFKYSPRAGTRSAELFDDDISDAVKRGRNNELLALQTEISTELNAGFVGRTVEVLVEGASKNAKKTAKKENSGALPILGQDNASTFSTQLTGRTPCDRIVVFDGPESLAGEILPVKIRSAAPFTLFGTLEE